MGLIEQQPELYVYPMEGRLAGLRLPFMQIQDLLFGRQKPVHGNILEDINNMTINLGNLLPEQ